MKPSKDDSRAPRIWAFPFLSASTSASRRVESTPSICQACELVLILDREGWTIRRQKGSHAHFKKPGYQHVAVTAVMHNRGLAPGTLRAILADAEISEKRFAELLRA